MRPNPVTAFSMSDPDISNEAETPIISAPASAKPSAIAIPIPRLQPVTSAILPVKSNVFFILFQMYGGIIDLVIVLLH